MDEYCKRLLIILLVLVPIVKTEIVTYRPINVDNSFELNFNNADLDTKKYLVFNEIRKLGIQHPEIVLAQTLLESANYTSRVFVKNNNMFGMKYPGRRQTTAIGSNMGYAKYSSWKKSIEDYAFYQKNFLKGKKLTNQEYLRKLHLTYAEDPKYVKLLSQIVSNQIHREGINTP